MPQLLLLGSLPLLLLSRWTGFTDSLPQCLLHDLTGFYCPGCGATRALELLARGDVLGAARMNALLPCALLFVPLLTCFDRTCARIYRSRAFAWVAVAVVLSFTIARNLPWEPFRLLAPGAMFAR